VRVAKKLILLATFFYINPCLATLADSLELLTDKMMTKYLAKTTHSYEGSYEQSYKALLDITRVTEHPELLHAFMFTEYSEHLALSQVSRFTYEVGRNAWILKIKEHQINQINQKDLSLFLIKERKLIEKMEKELTA